MKQQKLSATEVIAKMKKAFLNDVFSDDDVANVMLNLLDLNKEAVQFDSALNKTHRMLNIWSRSERNTGEVLDQINDMFGFKN